MSEPNYKDRVKMFYNDTDTTSGELYQDSVPIGYGMGIAGTIQDTTNVGNLANPDSKPDGKTISTVELKLQRLLDIWGGGDIGGTYRSITLEIPGLEQRYEIALGMYATQLVMRCDKDITVVFNNTTQDNVFLEVGDFPFAISELKINEAIHTIFVTTGTDEATIKILAFGFKKE